MFEEFDAALQRPNIDLSDLIVSLEVQLVLWGLSWEDCRVYVAEDWDIRTADIPELLELLAWTEERLAIAQYG